MEGSRKHMTCGVLVSVGIVYAMCRQVATALTLLVVTISATGCSDISKFFVNSPAPNGVVLASDLPTLNALVSSNPPAPDRVIAIPNGTKGRVLQRRYLKGGKLVMPYSANSYDMERDGAIEVALFEVSEGPKRGVKGWVQASFLRPDFWYL